MKRIVGNEIKVLGMACLCAMFVSEAVRGESPGHGRLAAMGPGVAHYVANVPSRSIRPVGCCLQDVIRQRRSATANCPTGACPQQPAGSTLCATCQGPSLCERIFGVQACFGVRQITDAARRLAGKLAYFSPSGCGGAGCPPFGDYHIVYAVQPDYFDARDSQIFAAPATGVPMAVPLAPNVHYMWNYSRGIPSSRLTPISQTVPPGRIDR